MGAFLFNLYMLLVIYKMLKLDRHEENEHDNDSTRITCFCFT